MSLELLTQLGRALAGDDTSSEPRARTGGLPAHLYYDGPPLGPAPPPRRPHVWTNSPLDREARWLAAEGDRRLQRFFATRSRVKRQAAKAVSA